MGYRGRYLRIAVLGDKVYERALLNDQRDGELLDVINLFIYEWMAEHAETPQIVSIKLGQERG